MQKITTKKLSTDELSAICEQTAILLSSGITIYDGAYIMYTESSDGAVKDVLKQLSDLVGQNMPFWAALGETKAFPEYMVHMVRTGETTGRLEDVLHLLGDHYAREYRLKNELRGAIMYPLILFAALTGIMGVLAWKILPMFERMFNDLSSDVSEGTLASMSAGLISGRVFALVLLAIVVAAVILGVLYKIPSTSHIAHRVFMLAKPVRSISELMATERAVSALSLMMASGVDPGLGLVREAEECEDPNVKKKLEKCLELYNSSCSLDEAIEQSELVCGMESRLLSVASKTGETDMMLEKLADSYNEKVTGALSKASTIVETTLVVSLSAIVAGILISVMVPLVNLISSIG